MSWIVAALVAYFGYGFVTRTIEKGKAKSLRKRQPVAGPSPKPPPPKTPCEVLGVPEGAPAADIARAYRALAVQYHPDKLVTSAPELRELAARRLREINAAYAELTSTRKEPSRRRA